MLAKIDFSDGFWHMLVRKSDKWNFAYVLPSAAGNPVRLTIPHALQMGWPTHPPSPKVLRTCGCYAL
jgi:hypothetical protein